MQPLKKVVRLAASAASDNATLFNGPIRLTNIIGYNARAGVVFLKIYERSAAQIAAGTVPTNADTPILVFALPASSGYALDLGDPGLLFSIGLGFRLVTGSADNDATAIAANDILGLNIIGG